MKQAIKMLMIILGILLIFIVYETKKDRSTVLFRPPKHCTVQNELRCPTEQFCKYDWTVSPVKKECFETCINNWKTAIDPATWCYYRSAWSSQDTEVYECLEANIFHVKSVDGILRRYYDTTDQLVGIYSASMQRSDCLGYIPKKTSECRKVGEWNCEKWRLANGVDDPDKGLVEKFFDGGFIPAPDSTIKLPK